MSNRQQAEFDVDYIQVTWSTVDRMMVLRILLGFAKICERDI